jgi:hypothetical protein
MTNRASPKNNAMTTTDAAARDAKLLVIAQKLLFLETLETRKMDGLEGEGKASATHTEKEG